MTAIALDVRRLEIRLDQGDTPLQECHELPVREYVDTYYSAPKYPLSIAELDADYERRCSTCVRYNAGRARRLGYRYERIDRAEWEDDLYELRSSTDFRQGRRMPAAYLERQAYSSDAWPEVHCKRHRITVHGVIGAGGLAAYAQLVQSGDVVRVNTILGHWDRLDDGVVWLLVLESLKWHVADAGARFALYYTHNSGHGDGLRYFKERFRFGPARVRWVFA